VRVGENVVDSVVVDSVDIEEEEVVHSNSKEAKVAPDDDDVKVEEVEDSHVMGQLGASQVHLVNIVDVEKDDKTVHDSLLLPQVFQ